MAENRKTACDFAEYSVVKEHFSELTKLFEIRLTVLAGKFLSSSLIGQNELDNVVNTKQPTLDLATTLLSNILKRIELDKTCYYRLVKVLKEFSDLDNMVGVLDSHLKRESTSSLPPASGTPSRDVPPHRGPDPHKSNSSEQTSLDGDSAFVEGQSVPANAEDVVGIRGTSSEKPANVSIKPPIAPTQSSVNMNVPVESTDNPSNYKTSPSADNSIQSSGPIVQAAPEDEATSQQVGLKPNISVPQHLSGATDHTCSHCRKEILFLKLHYKLQISETDYWKEEHQKRECELTELTKENSQHREELIKCDDKIMHLKENLIKKNVLIAKLEKNMNECEKKAETDIEEVLDKEKKTKEELVATQSKLIEAEREKDKLIGDLEKGIQEAKKLKTRLESEENMSKELTEKNRELSGKVIALLEEMVVVKQSIAETEVEKLQKKLDALNLIKSQGSDTRSLQ